MAVIIVKTERTPVSGIGDKLRRLRLRQRKTIQIVATDLGISTNTLVKLEKADDPITRNGDERQDTPVEYATLQKICEYYDTTIEELTGEV